jgi:hypothetical protein
MAIRDLLWGCPLCGTEGRLRDRGSVTVCKACGARLRRGAGAAIIAATPDGREREESPAAMVDRLPPPVQPAAEETLGPERATLRIAEQPVAFRPGGVFVGWGERFSPRRAGTAALTPESLVFQEEGGGAPHEWRLDAFTAVQPTSSALQIKTRDDPVAYLDFFESSVRRWEFWIQHRLRTLYRDGGKGEIVEFQPRISTR